MAQTELRSRNYNSPRGLDEMLYLPDWEEMYLGVGLQAGATLLGYDGAVRYLILGAKRNTSGWDVRGVWCNVEYGTGGDGFQGHLSRDMSTLTTTGYGGGTTTVTLDDSRTTAPTLFSYGIYGFAMDSPMRLDDIKQVQACIFEGDPLRDTIYSSAADNYGLDLHAAAWYLKHIAAWYRRLRVIEALERHADNHYAIQPRKLIHQCPPVREALALASREIAQVRADIARKQRRSRAR